MGDNFMAVVPGFLGMISLILAVAGGLWCEFVEVETRIINNEFGNVEAVAKPKFGLFYQRQMKYQSSTETNSSVTVYYTQQCQSWPSWVVRDSKWNAACGLQIASWTVAFFITMNLFLSTCFGGSDNLYRCTAYCYIVVVCLFQGLSFLIMRSDICTDNAILKAINGWVDDQTAGTWNLDYNSNCDIASGSVLVIVAMVGYFFAGLTCCCVGVDGDDDDDDKEQPKDEPEPAASTVDYGLGRGGGSSGAGGNN